ncbi:MAG TPA: adenosylmethionine--8-amino-7-oxononanoate transaminase [Chitinophagaceae bacterium]|nr:adenosylmethionine--8-amino-7-oxononanoate transaminase [Chitinophagaceae bacterium]
MSYLESDRKFIWHPFTHQKHAEDNLFIEKAEGAWLFDDQGKKYLDAISSWWVNIHGHAHPKISEAISKQAARLEHIIFAGFTHKPAIELAENIIPILPGDFAKIFYSDNGSTSTEVALKMSVQYWWNQAGKDASKTRKKILAFRNSYHGDTFGAMSVSDRGVFTLAFHDLMFEVLFLDTPTVENIEDSKKFISQYGQDIACFIYEPLVQGAGGMKIYQADLLDQLLETAKHFEIITIADEVMTGFGRTGKLFASEYMEQKPDIICLSKGLTGGSLPLSITTCTQKIYDAFVQDDKLKTFFHGHSYTANPIACAAAVASLELLKDENCMDSIQRISTSNLQFAKDLEDQQLPLSNIRSLGTILAFEVDDKSHEYLNVTGHLIGRTAMEKGLYIRPLGNTVYIMPPYCITPDETNTLYTVLVDSLYRSIGNW